MNVYKIKEGDETTHICHDGDKEEALAWYIEETMCDENDIDSIELFPKEKWKEVTIMYDVEDLVLSLEDYMHGQTWNEIICSTAYL